MTDSKQRSGTIHIAGSNKWTGIWQRSLRNRIKSSTDHFPCWKNDEAAQGSKSNERTGPPRAAMGNASW